MGALADIDTIVRYVAGSSDMRPVNKWWFPLAYGTGIPVNPHPGAFGYLRRDKRHTGIDLYAEDGDKVYAIEPGKIVCIEHFTGEWDNSPWWNNTDCILVEGKSGVICYGEVTPRKGLNVGDYVAIGESFADVRRVIKEGRERPEIPGWKPSMLHLELYPAGTKHPSSGFEPHLKDPTPYLLESYGRPKKELIYADYKPSST